MTFALKVLETGALATIQDLGRTGYSDLGVSTSGAADVASLRLANRLVGNAPMAAAIEVTLGGLAVRFEHAVTVSLTGADCGGIDHQVALSLPAGAFLRLGVPRSGLRTYLAVRGGVAVEPVLGSRSTDTLSGLGPAPLRPGDRLPIGDLVAAEIDGAMAVARPRPPRLHVVLGPRDDWFVPAARATLLGADWRVRSDSSRVGIRLDGPVLGRAVTAELPSEATLPGALQVPPDGRPILLGPDAPVTGGYPVIAVVRSDDLPHCGQLRPGDSIAFRL